MKAVGPRKPILGRTVKVNRTALQAIRDALAAAVARVLAKAGPKAAAHVRAELVANEAEIAAASDGGAGIIKSLLLRFDWSQWDDQLHAAVLPQIIAAHAQGAEEGMAALGAAADREAVSADAIKYAEARGAELVGKRRLADGTLVDNPNGKYVISNATREMIRDHVVSGLKAGNSPYEIEKSIQKHYAFSDARAETIARTETGFAYNRGQVGGYRAAGCPMVEVIDGDYDDECAQADGQVWTLERAEDEPLEHPNCTRTFAGIPTGFQEE